MTDLQHLETAFDCPHCGAFSQQIWGLAESEEIPHHSLERSRKAYDDLLAVNEAPSRGAFSQKTVHVVKGVSFSECARCLKVGIWIGSDLIYPRMRNAPPPNSDMPEAIREDYDEAADVLHISPRGSAALLRLAIQKLCKELGEKGKNINADIAALVKKGLDVRVQQAMDAVRLIGNDAVHPGQIDLKDDQDTARLLFGLINLVVEKMISEPKHVDAIYNLLPEDKKKAVRDRDADIGK